MVEMAMMFPLLLLFFLGTVDLGRVFFTAIEVSNAAAAGASFGSMSADSLSDIEGIAKAASQDVTNPQGLQVVSEAVCQNSSGFDVSCTTPGVYRYVKVSVSQKFKTLLNYAIFPSTTTIKKTVMMRAK